MRLSLSAEDIGYGPTLLGGDALVEVDEGQVEFFGEHAPDGGLARTHEPYQEHVVHREILARYASRAARMSPRQSAPNFSR